MSIDLSHHGDADLVPGLVDLAVNVRSGGTPGWLAERIRGTDLAAYPDQREAVAAVAARHGRAAGEVLLTAGAAEAFVLLARALRPRHAVVVHPQFTEPEAALRAAGHQVDRVILPFPFTLDPGLVPDDADLVFVGNPTNPTSVAHPRDGGARAGPAGPDRRRRRGVRRLPAGRAGVGGRPRRPHRARRDPQPHQDLGARRAPGRLPARRAGHRPPARGRAAAVGGVHAGPGGLRRHRVRRARCARRGSGRSSSPPSARTCCAAWTVPSAGVRVVPDAAASFVLLDTRVADVRARLLGRGFAVRRGETFPGLGPGWIRVAVRDAATSDRFAAALAVALSH